MYKRVSSALNWDFMREGNSFEVEALKIFVLLFALAKR